MFCQMFLKLLTPCLQESRLHLAGFQILDLPRAGLDFCWAVPDQGLLTHYQDNFATFPFQGRMPVYCVPRRSGSRWAFCLPCLTSTALSLCPWPLLQPFPGATGSTALSMALPRLGQLLQSSYSSARVRLLWPSPSPTGGGPPAYPPALPLGARTTAPTSHFRARCPSAVPFAEFSSRWAPCLPRRTSTALSLGLDPSRGHFPARQGVLSLLRHFPRFLMSKLLLLLKGIIPDPILGSVSSRSGMTSLAKLS